MRGSSRPELPAFDFPVIAWAPEPATGDPGDDGTRAFVTPDEVTTTYMPNSDLRLGWTFVDATGRCWEAISSRVVGRAEAWWARWFVWDRRYRLELDFAERPPIAFDSVMARLHAAVTANPEVYPDDARERRKELGAARNLGDLIKSDEARAIERLRPQTPWEQWLFWEGRCSRRGFLGASATFFLAIWLVGWLRVPGPAWLMLLLPFLILWMSAVVRRMHDLRYSAWLIAAWFAFSLLMAVVHDFSSAAAARDVAAVIWQISTLLLLGGLAAAPGTQGPNRYGL